MTHPHHDHCRRLVSSARGELHAVVAGAHAELAREFSAQRLRAADIRPGGEPIENPGDPRLDAEGKRLKLGPRLGRDAAVSHDMIMTWMRVESRPASRGRTAALHRSWARLRGPDMKRKRRPLEAPISLSSPYRLHSPTPMGSRSAFRFSLSALESPPMSTTIEIRRLAKHYKSFGHGVAKAVDEISLTIPAGSLFFLLGPSGCGKTTLLRMIAGFIEPTGGEILFDGRDVSNVRPNKRNTGMVFQSYALWPHMTVEQNVAFGLSVRKVAREERARRVMEALRAVRMDEYAKRKPNQLSGGQQQRVALARALVVRPRVLLLDEPLSNLDAKLRGEMRHEIKRICHESRLTTVYVTHDQKEALSMADQIAVLDGGRVAQIGTPSELYRRPRSRFVADFLGETNFIEGEVIAHAAHSVHGVHGPGVRVRTAAGEVMAHVEAGASPGRVTCSIRPESLRIVEPKSNGQAGTLTGRIAESTYLGEMTQHLVDLTGGVRVRVNQVSGRPVAEGETVALAAEPSDVVVLTR